MLLTWQLWPTLLQHCSFLQPYYLTPSFLLHFKSGDKSLAKKLTTKQKKYIFTHWITCVEIFHELWYKLEIILCDQYIYSHKWGDIHPVRDLKMCLQSHKMLLGIYVYLTRYIYVKTSKIWYMLKTSIFWFERNSSTII